MNPHHKHKFNKHSKIPHLAFSKTVWLPNTTGEFENHETVEDSIDDQEGKDDEVEVKESWKILPNHTGSTNTEIIIKVSTRIEVFNYSLIIITPSIKLLSKINTYVTIHISNYIQ